MLHPKNNQYKAQASIEFSLAFVICLLFLLLTCRVFAWFSRDLLNRQLAYEGSRRNAGRGINAPGGGTPGDENFYNQTANFFSER